MIIRKQSIHSGIWREVDLPVTPEQISAWMDGAHIQRVMPHLTADQREFLMTGIIAEEWEEMFKEEPE